MADFVQRSNVKSAVRILANKIPDVDAFNTIVESVITSNSFECVAYMTAGQSHEPVDKSKEAYTAKIGYEDSHAKIVGTISDRYGTISGFKAGILATIGNQALAVAHGGTPAQYLEKEAYSVTLRCHDPNGELYFVTMNRDRIPLISYADEAIRAKVESWADSVPALA
jgi:hypothetical protein